MTTEFPLTTTSNRIQACIAAGNFCESLKSKMKSLLNSIGKNLPDDEPVSYEKLMDIHFRDSGMYSCLQYLEAEPQYSKFWRMFAVWCAKQECKIEGRTKSPEGISAMEVAERHCNGEVTDEELYNAWHNSGEDCARPNACHAGTCAAYQALGAAWTLAAQSVGGKELTFSIAWKCHVKNLTGIEAATVNAGNAAYAALEATLAAAFRQLVTTGTLP